MKRLSPWILAVICLFVFKQNLRAQVANDSCSMAIYIPNVTNHCGTYSYDSVTFDVLKGVCAPPNLGNVWYRFRAQGEGLFIEVDVPDTIDAYITVFTPGADPCNVFSMNQVACAKNYLSTVGVIDSSQLYYFSISLSDTISNYSFCMQNPLGEFTPQNEYTCSAELITPDGSLTYGTNINARSDWNSLICPANTVSTVWYKFRTDPGHTEAEIIVDRKTFTDLSGISVLKFVNGCASAPNFIFDAFLCSDNTNNDTLYVDDLESNTDYFIMVGTNQGGEGNFGIRCTQFQDPSGCAINDNCSTASWITAPNSSIEFVCFEGCNLSATPGPTNILGDCFYMQNPTTWHKFVPNPGAFGAVLQLSSEHLHNPQIAIYRSTSDCDTLVPLSCNFSTNGLVQASVFDLDVDDTYYVAVSDITGNYGDYDICIDFYSEELDCNINSSIRVVSTSFGSPYTGPYQSGELIEMCYTLNAWNEDQCNWVQGVVPVFGQGWDETSFLTSGKPAIITKNLEPHTTGAWDWYTNGSLRYKVDAPDKGYYENDPLPGGWYFTNYAYGNTPDVSRGDSQDCTNDASSNWEVCFQLKVKSFDDCEDLNNKVAQVHITTFSDSEVGIHNQVSCLSDQSDYFEAPIFCCEPISIPDNNGQVCNNERFIYDLNPNQTPGISFKWTPILPNGVYGAEADSGQVIDDVLLNLTASGKIVQYLISTIDQDGCQGPPATLNIRVNPKIFADAGANKLACAGSPVRLGGSPTAFGGSGNFNYAWSVNSNEANPIVVINETQYAYLTVIDSRNCRAVDSVLVDIKDAPRAQIITNSSSCAGKSFLVSVNLQGTPPFIFNVYENNNLVDQVYTNDFDYAYFADINVNTVIKIGELRDNICDAASDHSVTVNVTETPVGIVNYQICANESVTINGVTINQAGTFDIALEGQAANGCDSIVRAVITKFPEVFASAATSPDNGTNNGSINLSVSGGNPPFTFLWSNGKTTEDISNLSKGFYTVTVKDQNDCSFDFTFEVRSFIGNFDIEDGYDIQMLPNPIYPQQTLIFKGDVETVEYMRIFDFSGKMGPNYPIQRNSANEISIRLSEAAGSYMIGLYNKSNELIFMQQVLVL